MAPLQRLVSVQFFMCALTSVGNKRALYLSLKFGSVFVCRWVTVNIIGSVHVTLFWRLISVQLFVGSLTFLLYKFGSYHAIIIRLLLVRRLPIVAIIGWVGLIHCEGVFLCNLQCFY